MPNLFLSYARKDIELVQSLISDLRELGNTVWFDEEVSPGQAWWDHILEQIRACDGFVYALSPDALASLACERESTYAAALGKPILPILLTGDEPRNRLSPDLVKIQYVDYREPTRATGLRLGRALLTMPPAPPLPETLPAPPEVPISYLNQLSAQIFGSVPLSQETQSALVLDLRRHLNDPAIAEDVRVLLVQLWQRRDLLAWIAEEIDETLGTTSAAFLAQLTALQTERDDLLLRKSALQMKIEEVEAELLTVQQALTEEQAAHQAIQREYEELQQHVSELQEQLHAYEASQSTASERDNTYSNSIGMRFVPIPEGIFQMGSNDDNGSEQPVHQVAISQLFYLGQYQVTQAQWQAVMGCNPSKQKGDDLPVTDVSWNDTQKFIEKLNATEDGHIYRLPTEAEWEYAARAGTTTAYSFGDDPALLDQYGWSNGNSDNHIHAVGQLGANPWGLYDFSTIHICKSF